MPLVLDPCCGSRMMWFDRADPRAVFGDQRAETITVTDNSRGNTSGTRTIVIEPDTLLDFRALPYADGAFLNSRAEEGPFAAQAVSYVTLS